MRALNVAATGMQAQQTSLDVISNNLANLSTAAFKRQRPEFSDLLYENKTRPGTNGSADGSLVPTGLQLGLGVKIGSVYRIHQQGSFEETGNSFDMAINGRGYFQIQLPGGDIAYTRAGQFQPNENGELVNSLGHLLEPSITIPQDAVSIDINQEGEVIANFDDQVQAQVLGQIEIAVFVNEAGLLATGNNLYKETEASGPPLADVPGEPGYGFVLQGFVENSNVDPVSEITRLITTQRGFELNSRVISTGDEMLAAVTQIR